MGPVRIFKLWDEPTPKGTTRRAQIQRPPREGGGCFWAGGKSKEEIKAEVVELYGPVVLGEPPQEGFDLLAWIMPVGLALAGLGTAIVLTRRWTRRAGSRASPAIPPSSSDSEDDYLARVEEEVDDL